MIIGDFLEVFYDNYGELEVFNLDTNETVFLGHASEAPADLFEVEIASVDWPCGFKLVINIENE